MSFLDWDDIIELDDVKDIRTEVDVPEVEIVEVTPEDSVDLWLCDPKEEMKKNDDSIFKVESNEVDFDFPNESTGDDDDPLADIEAIIKMADARSISKKERIQSADEIFGIEPNFISKCNNIIQSQPSQSNKSGTVCRRRLRGNLSMKRMCHICGKIFKYPESLRRHLKTVHSDEKPFQCHLCPSNFNRNHNLTIHIKVVHQRQRVYVKKHVPRLCDYCGKVLLSTRSLEEHISSLHTKKALYECEKCHSTFFRKLSYDKHRNANECSKKPPRKCSAAKTDEVFLKYCEHCGLEFKKEHFYEKHKDKHLTTLTCSHCSLKFENTVVLKDHIDSVHPEVSPYECNVCNKRFKHKSLLNCHVVIHGGEKRYECEYCNLKFLKKKYLTTHILTHTGERPFKCTICQRAFKQSGDMRKHKATHIRNQTLIYN